MELWWTACKREHHRLLSVKGDRCQIYVLRYDTVLGKVPGTTQNYAQAGPSSSSSSFRLDLTSEPVHRGPACKTWAGSQAPPSAYAQNPGLRDEAAGQRNRTSSHSAAPPGTKTKFKSGFLAMELQPGSWPRVFAAVSQPRPTWVLGIPVPSVPDLPWFLRQAAV